MDLPFGITLEHGGSRANKTGSWRTERPVYVHHLPPCNQACPAGEDVRSWLYDGESGGDGYERAWRAIMEVNPFPAVMGRICYHPCETGCNRGQLDEAVGINSVERFLGDEAIRAGWRMQVDRPSSGRRVVVVGAGPSGLSAAYHLVRLGHAVTLLDSAPRPGGMMRYGIPAYRLPREVLDAEIQRILDLGVDLRTDTTVTDLDQTLREDGYDAAFLAVGAPLGHRAHLPAGSAAKIVDAVTMLHGLEEGERPLLGRRVAVYGGGNTAMDAARTAKRLGAEDALVVYRRTRERMPAHESEVREAEEEGVRFTWLSTITQVQEGMLTLERMELDETGFPQPTGETEELPADAVVLALGQDTDLAFLGRAEGVEVEDGVVVVDDSQMTGRPGVFAGGDVAPGPRSATVAIGQGRRAATSIDAWLRGAIPERVVELPLADFAALNTWYYTDAPRSHRPVLEAARRASTFDEVVQGLNRDTALYEARRCMSCGNCISCDNCFGVCPDNAVIKVDDADAPYLIDLDFCKGCGLCAAECPAGAIAMVPEEI
ncbi:MAG: NAD(P)-binding protein [Nocardioides sp.]|nr:NAD(P)-binding protein [Nocardioides sp.]